LLPLKSVDASNKGEAEMELLTSQWYDRRSVKKTLIHLIENFDSKYLKSISKSSFERDLTKEIIYLSVYEKAKEPEVISFIREHIDELYEKAKKRAKEPRGKHGCKSLSK
jgi:hypothetical protein